MRAGQLSTAFGAFLLRYDDMQNPLLDMPVSYGYYSGTTVLGLAGVQVDASVHKLDFRAQFVNSSPANPRSILDRDQYGDWAGGIGYTIKQGFRVGASTYRGPYLDRQSPFYFPGEAKPRDLPATAVGVDVAWGRGPWNVYGEWQRFQMDYRLIPTFHEQVGYGEVRRVLGPRWYVAERISYIRASAFPGYQVYETAVGYRPNAHQLIKVGYEVEQGPATQGAQDNTFAIQFVTAFRALSLGRDIRLPRATASRTLPFSPAVSWSENRRARSLVRRTPDSRSVSRFRAASAMASASAAGSSGGTSQPVSPDSTISGKPPMRRAITGKAVRHGLQRGESPAFRARRA